MPACFRRQRPLPVPRWNHGCTSRDLSCFQSNPLFGPPFQFLSLQEALLVRKGVVANSQNKQVGEDWSMAAGNRAWRSQGPAQSLVEGSVETWSDSEDSPDLPGSHKSRLSPPACARVGGRRTDESPELWIHLQDSHSRSR